MRTRAIASSLRNIKRFYRSYALCLRHAVCVELTTEFVKGNSTQTNPPGNLTPSSESLQIQSDVKCPASTLSEETMPPATQFESGSTSRLRAILTRITQFVVVGTIVLGACDRTIVAPTKVPVQEPGIMPENAFGPLGGTRGSLETAAIVTGLHHEVTYPAKFCFPLMVLEQTTQQERSR